MEYINIAEWFGIDKKVSALVDKLNTMPNVESIDFDLNGYLDRIYEVILIITFRETPESKEMGFYKAKDKFLKDVLKKCKSLGLKRTSDRIEEYGDYSYYIVFDSSSWNADRELAITATCSCCGKEETYTLKGEEVTTFEKYQSEGRSMGYLQDLFPKVPNWIRSGCIDQFSGGFCVCPDCGM